MVQHGYGSAGNGYGGVDAHGNPVLNAVSGQIDVVNNIAISGLINVTSGSALGTYNLTPVANPLVDYSVLGSTSHPIWGNYSASEIGTCYDDVVDPGVSPFVDILGLLFTGGPNGTTQLTIFWNEQTGQVEYGLYGNVNGDIDNPLVDAGTATLTPVPEPTTIIAGALLLLPFGASTLRILRRKTHTA